MENRQHPLLTNRLMLRFRPIAPKPAGGDAAAEPPKYGRRTKRKYVRARGRQTAKSRPPPPPPAVTLQLLPERSESEKSDSSSSTPKSRDLIMDPDLDPEEYRSGAAATWIVVERVMDTRGLGLGYLSDEEILRSLEGEACPGFVTDAANNVVWANEACRRMAALVRLVVAAEELPDFTPAFACTVRMVQQTDQGQKWNKIVACDVWRMEFAAAFAWKLDVQTALGLGV